MEEGKAVVLEAKDQLVVRETKKVYPGTLPSKYVKVAIKSTGICASHRNMSTGNVADLLGL